MKKLLGLENIPYWKMFFLLYLGGFLTGIVFANLTWRYRIEDLNLIRRSSFSDFAQKKINYENYFYYLIPKRLLVPAILLVAGVTVFGLILVILRILWLGFLAGTLMSIFVLQNGIFGAGNFVLGIFPQVLWNIPLTALIFLKCYQMSQDVWKGKSLTYRQLGNYLLWAAAFFICLLWGCLLEAYLNPRLIGFFLHP